MKESVVGVIRRAGRVLVIQRGPGARLPGYWTAPSGRIEPGESQAQTLVREMREELGLDVSPIAKVWECETDDGCFLLHWWTVEEDGAELRPDPNEVAAVKWVNAAEFVELEPRFRNDGEFFRVVLPALE